MKVVLICETYPRNMGYFGTMFPKYLARLGAEVHVLTLDLPPYWQIPAMRETYLGIIGEDWLRPGVEEAVDGYTVHVMAHRKLFGQMAMPGLRAKLRTLRPDVVYSLSAIGWLALQAAAAKLELGFKLFTGSHTTASTYPPAQLASLHPKRLAAWPVRWLPGRLVSILSERCYAPTVDSAEIAWRHFGVQRRKVAVMHLGVDTDVFFPVHPGESAQDREDLRTQWGLGSKTVLCIYTGKFTEEKNPLILVNAVESLNRAGADFKALFVGDGPLRELLGKSSAAMVIPFLPYQQLGQLYRAADVAVWPTNESTSMLDAAACGLPLIVSDGIVYRDHVEGNGLVYRMNNLEDLVDNLRALADPEMRQKLGNAGAEKMATHFSWLEHARKRLTEYEQVVQR